MRPFRSAPLWGRDPCRRCPGIGSRHCGHDHGAIRRTSVCSFAGGCDRVGHAVLSRRLLGVWHERPLRTASTPKGQRARLPRERTDARLGDVEAATLFRKMADLGHARLRSSPRLTCAFAAEVLRHEVSKDLVGVRVAIGKTSRLNQPI
jgi:hypothetical protein